MAELFQRAGADLPAGHVHDAQECRVVIRVHQQTQIGHGVLDLVLGEKQLATGDVIGDLVSLQFHFQQPGLASLARHCFPLSRSDFRRDTYSASGAPRPPC